MTEEHGLDPIACFLTACEVERREYRAAGREHKVVHGRRVSAEHGRFVYNFDIQAELPFKEDATVQVVVKSGFYVATVVGKTNRSVTLSLSSDLGPQVPTARIEGEEVDLLQALIFRLKEIKSKDNLEGFNSELAAQALRLTDESDQFREDDLTQKPPEDLTQDQRAAYLRGLSQPLTFLWGPPGTGKTVLLGALAWQLFQQNKRILIVSHTNQAVDGVLESLCKRITDKGRASIPEGSILRLGSLVKDSLIRQWGEQVQLDLVMNRSHDKVSSRLAALKTELAEVRTKLFETSKKMTLLESYAQLHAELLKLRSKLRSEDTGLVHAVRRVFHPTSPAPEETPAEQEMLKESVSLLESNLAHVTAELQGCERAELADLSMELSSRQLEITEAIALLEKFTRDLRLSLLDRARIVATTATQAMLSARDLNGFDAVLIDEASMLPLPLCYLLTGMARERVVIAGDFRQLPAIAVSDSHMVRLWYTRDIFDCAGVIDRVDSGARHSAIVTLTTQFRSNETLCDLINERFYGGVLKTMKVEYPPVVFKEPLTYLNRYPIVLVDTSPLEPRGHTLNNSKSNLMHALLVRKIAVSLVAAGLCDTPEGLGIIAPYRPQVSLIRDLLDEYKLSAVSVGTVHRFQGSERGAIILDLTDSPPHRLGTFLRPVSLRDTGARLLNVALSRARQHLFVVANLSHLRSQVHRQHLLSGVLDDLERLAYRIPVDELIGEALTPSRSLEINEKSGVFAFQAFDEQFFLPGLMTDLIEARYDVVISAPRLSSRVVMVLSTLLRDRIQKGLRVTMIIDGAANIDDGEQRALKELRDVGVLVIKSLTAPIPYVVVDSEVVWLGSLSPADCLAPLQGLMVRCVSNRASSVILEMQNPQRDTEGSMAAVAL